MDDGTFCSWLARIDDLTEGQRLVASSALACGPSYAPVVAALETGSINERHCPHCGSEASVGRGMANGLRRFRCKTCRKSFNALTGTPLARLRKKDRWLSFSRSLSEGETVVKSAKRCRVAVSTAFRWRHRFLCVANVARPKLGGIVEADETYVLSSRKGERHLDRKARRRGGKAAKRGLSDEQTPVLVAVDRGGATLAVALPAATASNVATVLEPILEKDALLVTDASTIYPPCAKSLGISHEALNASAGERVRGELHIQTANSRHEGLKTLLRRHRGIATKYLGSYLNWFEMVGAKIKSTPRDCLNAALGPRRAMPMPS